MTFKKYILIYQVSYPEFVVTKSPSGIRKQKYGLRPETYPKMST